jgi:hypothetical protein
MCWWIMRQVKTTWEGVELETAVLPDSGHLSSEQSAERSIHGDAFR